MYDQKYYEKLRERPEYNSIPQSVWDSMVNYVVHHLLPGSFLKSVIENDLMQAILYADDDTIVSMKAIAKFFWNHVPNDCWGNRERFKAHIESKGFKPRVIVNPYQKEVA